MFDLDSQIDTVKEEFDRNGFAVLRNVVDPALIEETRAHVEWLTKRYPDLRPEHFHHPLVRNDAFWVRLITDSRFVDIAERFLGPDLACFTAHYICKPPYDGHPVLWHQDAAFWNLEPMQALTIWVAVDEATTENGCLRMIPGTHKLPIYTPEQRTDTPNMLASSTGEDVVAEWIERAGIVDVELQPGDVEIHHPNILHCSEPNRSAKRRCGLDIGYISTSTSISNDGLYLDPILVRGEPVDGRNRYRRWPEFRPEETIGFRGSAEWNDRAAAFNGKGDFSGDSAESPLEITQRMIDRLQEGTVKR
jgi:phytanoyl-CoA hydroxylase